MFYRINVIHLELPALRERASDIPLLVEHFLQKSVQETGKEIDGFTPEAMQALCNYQWPGNIRELENVVQRAVLLSKRSELELSLLPPVILGTTAGQHGISSQPLIMRGQTLRDALEGPERQIILEVLKLNNFTVT